MPDKTPRDRKILYIITKSNFGGAQRYVYDLATAMQKRGRNVVVAMGGDGTLKEKLIQQGIATVTLPSLERDIHAGKDVRAFFDIFTLIKKERPDVVHTNSSKAGILGAIAGRLARVPSIIFTVHGWAFNENRGVLQKVFIFAVSWLTACLSHYVITVSRYDYNQARSLGCGKKRYVMIHNGAGIQQFIDRKKVRIVLGGAQTYNKLWVGTIAELHKNKGLSYAIKAIALLPQDLRDQLVYYIIGDGEGRAALEALIKEKKLEDTVFLIGYKDNAASLLPAFDIFLLPSEKEGLPYVLLEAGLAGVATISTNVGGIPEIIEDMKTGILVHPHNPDEIKTALSYLMTNKEKREQFGKLLHEKIKKEFSTNKMLEKTLEIYDYS